jgi:hypothetical protein
LGILKLSLFLEKEKRNKKKKKWSKVHNRPIYHSHSEDSDEGGDERVPRAKAIRKYRDDGHEEYYEDRMEYVHIVYIYIQDFYTMTKKKK